MRRVKSLFHRIMKDSASPVLFGQFGETVRYLSAETGVQDEKQRQKHDVRAVVDRFPQELDDNRRIRLKIDVASLPSVMTQPLEGRDALEVESPDGRWVRYRVVQVVQVTDVYWELDAL